MSKDSGRAFQPGLLARRLAAAIFDLLFTLLAGLLLFPVVDFAQGPLLSERMAFVASLGPIFAPSAVYYVFATGRYGRTPLQAQLGLRVSGETGPPGYLRSFVRWLLAPVPVILLLLFAADFLPLDWHAFVLGGFVLVQTVLLLLPGHESLQDAASGTFVTEDLRGHRPQVGRGREELDFILLAAGIVVGLLAVWFVLLFVIGPH